MVDTPQVTETGAENIVWDLSVFYNDVDDPRIEADMDALRADVAAFAEQYRGKVATLGAAELAQAMAQRENHYNRLIKLAAFAQLNYATDTNDTQIGALVQKITQFGAELRAEVVFFDLEWQEADEAHVQAILADPAVARYRHTLEAELRYRPYTLSEPEEKVMIALNVSGRSAWTRFFSQLSAAMRYDYDGEQITMSDVLSKLYETDRDVRQKAADSVTAGLQEKMMELTYIFNVLASDKSITDNLRGYPSWVSSRNLSNKAPDAVVQALIETVTSNYDLVARHYTLKRKLLGLDELTDYDRYAPLPLEAGEKMYQWDEARDVVLGAFNEFSPQMSQIAGRFFSENWIHAPVLPHKRGGAFCATTTTDAHPYVLVNFLGKAKDVSTLAHELGHGIHGYLAMNAQGLFGADTPLTTAEMASTFGEMLVFTDLMEKETNPAAQLAMLFEKIESTFATVFRQVSMNRFEHAMHTAYREEGELSTERLNELWLGTQRDMFQGSVTMREDYGYWWSYVPHFLHTPGYVYAYAFGELLVLALFELYKEQGADFVPKYMDVLAMGGNDYPDNILKVAGVNLNDPAFWGKGIEVIRDLVDQEEALAKQVHPQLFA